MPKTKVAPLMETKTKQEKDSTSSLFYFVSSSVVVFYLILAKGPPLIISADDMESDLTLTNRNFHPSTTTIIVNKSTL